MKKSLPFIAAACTGILLFFAFPPFSFVFCGWIGLVPLLLACAGTRPRRAALLGWLAGAVFFLSTLYWLRHVTWLGMIALALYCAIYFIPFAVFVSLRRNAWRSKNGLHNFGWMLGAAAVWAASEYLRAIVITGFPWNLLGVSQYQQLPLIQIAEWGGVYSISALMVMVNAATAITLLQYVAGLRGRRYQVHAELLVSLLLLAAVWSVGVNILLNRPVPNEIPFRAALIQPNIPEVGNWELADPELIYDRLEKLTELVVRDPMPDMVIWPETALPDAVRYSKRSAALVRKLAFLGAPILAGSMDVTWNKDGSANYYNASMLFDPRGNLLSTYYKQHLVLFGEYIPFDEKIPLVNALTPINSSFKPGHSPVPMCLPGDFYHFCVLICFEDSLPYLARRAAAAGATFLVNQTNDSWFDPDCGSVQHLSHAIFRCIETRMPMLRCANTGITCSIDRFGRIKQSLPPRKEGFQAMDVTPASPDRPPTFYVKYGDVFAQACLLLSVALFITLFIRNRKEPHA